MTITGRLLSIENKSFKISVKEKGAELCEIFDKKQNKHILWDGNPQFWGKHAPVLFPFIGKLEGGEYRYKNQSYPMEKHGFARDCDWKLKEQTEGKLIFQIQSNKELREIYPFDFSLLITFSLNEEGLSCHFTLQNLSSEELLYSLGAHPAFFVPFDDSLSLEDYQLDFGTNIHANYYPLSEDGFIKAGALINLLNNESTLQLKDALFVNDALIIPDLTVNKVKEKVPI